MRTLEIFEPRQHYCTVVDRTGRKNARRIRIRSVEQLERLVANQPVNTDMYITKYAKHDVVWNIILDFDYEDKRVAYDDAYRLREYLKSKDVNMVIVDSTNKGFHGYIEIPPTNFREFPLGKIEEPSLFFKEYVRLFCNLDKLNLPSLDEVNFNASLDGNIRVINSIHPKTNKQVCIVKGEFHDFVADFDDYYYGAMTYHSQIVQVAYKKYKERLDEIETKRLQYREALQTEDDLLNKDLRDVFQSLFPLQKVRNYGGAIWCKCPWHNDSNPSFCITETHYFCASCGEKGNIFTLIKKGLIESPKHKYWLTEGAKKYVKQ